MGLSFKPEYLKRYTQLACLLAKHGRSDLVRDAGLDDVLPDAAPVDGPPAKAEELVEDLEAMGPTFIKLGQLLSTRTDLLPPAYTTALSRLQDRVEPFEFAQVEAILQDELGVRTSKAFLDLDAEPVAAASLGQVHRATLRDGRRVAVKVQRPDIRKRIVTDLDALAEIAEFLDQHTSASRSLSLQAMLRELRGSLLRELDYRLEADNLRTLADNLVEFEEIVVPRPVDDYTTSRVLTMEYVPGRKITSVSPLARTEMAGERLAQQLFRAYLTQILVNGFFHADPHPGNVFLTDDGRLALLDVGMVGRITPELQEHLLHLLLSLSEGRGIEAAQRLTRMSERLEEFNRAEFERSIAELVVRFASASAQQLQIGRLMMEVTRTAAENGLRVPAQLTMLGKALLNLDQVGRILDPEFEPNEAVREYATELMQRRMLKDASPGNAISHLLEMNDFVQRLPSRLNRVLDTVAEGEVELKMTLTNEAPLIYGLQKVANRIALGLILAALIIGAAMLMRVETSFRILGYPGIAMLLFLAAALGGALLVGDILRHDWRDRSHRH